MADILGAATVPKNTMERHAETLLCILHAAGDALQLCAAVRFLPADQAGEPTGGKNTPSPGGELLEKFQRTFPDRQKAGKYHSKLPLFLFQSYCGATIS